MDMIIRNGTVVSATGSYKADVAVKDGKIAAVGSIPDIPGAKVVDAAGKLVLPGAIDAHTHLAMPFGGTVSSDDYFAGTRAAAKRGTKLPVLAKMTPNIGNMEIPATAAKEGGADGIAAINTVKSLTRVDLDSMVSCPGVNGKCSVSGYSGKAVKPIALRFIHDMAVCPELSGMPLSGIGGIESWHDALEFIALGCENIQITTAVMQYGYRIIDDLISGTRAYLAAHGMSRLSELTGSALANIVPADDLDRSTVVYPVFGRESCVGCGRCCISCMDGGHQAIAMGADRKPHLTGGNCVGCLLCTLVCPTGSITHSKRVKKPGR